MPDKATGPQGKVTGPQSTQGLGTAEGDFSPFGQPRRFFPFHPPAHHPPCTYSGLLHSRIAVFMPPPQVLEQLPKGLQVPQAPSITGASRSLGTHIPNRQCCTRRRETGKVGLRCFGTMSRPPACMPRLRLTYFSATHETQQGFCNRIKLNFFTFCLSPPYLFFFLFAPLNEEAKASCGVHRSDFWER